MIYFKGTKKNNKIDLLIFENENGRIVEIPVDQATAIRICKYLEIISPPIVIEVERGNDELSE